MKKMMTGLWIAWAMLSIPGTVAAGSDKTLVSWVTLDNLTQQGGSALTLQRGDEFDGIVFGERVSRKWMAGSDFFKRTQGDQQPNAVEQADDKTLIQMAIVYEGNQVSIYHNGKPYASYQANNIALLSAKDNLAVFGLRHDGAGGGQNLHGAIEEARIYDRALTAEEIRKLEPNKESAIKPFAWWTFEKGKEADLMGRFPFNELSGSAKIEGGRLVLQQDGALIANAQNTVAAVETPAMPANPPANWLTYHLAHPGPGSAFPGDPNCAFYWKGRYHLHYIYNNNRKGCSFAHVSSTDLVHWVWHPTTLSPKTTGHGMFSGTGFITKDGQSAIIYHGQGSGRNQLAFALDDQLEQWTKPVAINLREASGEESKARQWDPDCWLNGDTYYGISGGNPPHLMKSPDLKEWRHLGLLLHEDMPTTLGVKKEEDVSCANMFKLGDKWMLLCISHGLGCRYYLGDFKDEKYLPDFHAMMNWQGWDFFAPESVLTKDGRRVMWAWCNVSGAQTGIQSLPRELSLPKDGVLRIKPLRELQALRYDETSEGNITVRSDSTQVLKKIAGDTLELEVTFKPTTAREYGVNVFCDVAGNGFPITIKAERKTLAIGKIEAPFEVKQGEALNLRIFLDKGMVEVFANDRQAVVYMQQHKPEDVGVSLFSRGGDASAKEVKGWKMKSIYAVPQTAAAERVGFSDRFDGRLGDGWTWLRENPKTWRLAEGTLDIRVEPGVADTVKNALLRKAPDRTKGKVAIDVTVTFTAPPTKQFEQAGLTWYQDGKPVFKLVLEQIDGKTYIIPGKIAAPEKTVQLRLVVTADQFTAQFRPDAKGEFQTVASGALPPGTNEEISLQCYNGPADAEHWVRFEDFSIVQLSE